MFTHIYYIWSFCHHFQACEISDFNLISDFCCCWKLQLFQLIKCFSALFQPFLGVFRFFYLCSLTGLHFPCKNDVLITSTRMEFSNHKNIAVAYTNFLSIASCRIVNVRYRNDLLVTEIRVANSAVGVRVVNSAVRVRFSSENYGILKDCWMKLLDSCV